jgi:hypothetical protein
VPAQKAPKGWQKRFGNPLRFRMRIIRADTGEAFLNGFFIPIINNQLIPFICNQEFYFEKY